MAFALILILSGLVFAVIDFAIARRASERGFTALAVVAAVFTLAGIVYGFAVFSGGCPDGFRLQNSFESDSQKCSVSVWERKP
jgi:membrane associated rhomboid family serine protease